MAPCVLGAENRCTGPHCFVHNQAPDILHGGEDDHVGGPVDLIQRGLRLIGNHLKMLDRILPSHVDKAVPLRSVTDNSQREIKPAGRKAPASLNQFVQSFSPGKLANRNDDRVRSTLKPRAMLVGNLEKCFLRNAILNLENGVTGNSQGLKILRRGGT